MPSRSVCKAFCRDVLGNHPCANRSFFTASDEKRIEFACSCVLLKELISMPYLLRVVFLRCLIERVSILIKAGLIRVVLIGKLIFLHDRCPVWNILPEDVRIRLFQALDAYIVRIDRKAYRVILQACLLDVFHRSEHSESINGCRVHVVGLAVHCIVKSDSAVCDDATLLFIMLLHCRCIFICIPLHFRSVFLRHVLIAG